MNGQDLSKKWLCCFVALTAAALGVFAWACVLRDVTVMVATGLVSGLQVMNIVQWFQNRSKGK